MRFLKCLALTLVSVLFLFRTSVAQEDVDQFLTENISDAKKLIGAYADPLMKSVSLGLNQGWYNTAKPHKIAGLDLTLTVNMMTIPNSDFFYDATKLGLQSVVLDNSSDDYPLAPTIFGPDRTPTFRETSTGTTFDGPPGLGIKENLKMNKMPVPMVHFAFGLPKGTEVKFRFVPQINLGDDSSLKLIGFGVMHDIKQWIPGVKLLPFDLSGFVGYTKFEVTTQLDPNNPQNADQRGIFAMNAVTVQGLISKKFSVITFYGGMGYNVAKSNLDLKGAYDLNEDGDETDQYERNPIDLNFAASGPRVTLGTRLKLAVFTFHADYTLQKYKCLTVGFGISVR